MGAEPGRGRGRPPIGARVTVRLPPDVIAALDRAANDAGVTRAEIVRATLTTLTTLTIDDGDT